jgi:hypothetical protein
MRRLWKAGLTAAAVLVLTATTQVGGVALLVGLAVGRAPQLPRHRAVTLLVPAAAYALATLLVVPLLAPAFGRVPLPWRASAEAPVGPLTVLTCALNRHYARPAARDLLVRSARALATRRPGETVRYLDAGFPFGGGFPMLPHLSHGDGRKIDLAFAYLDPEQRPWIGYGASEPPRAGEVDTAAACARAGHWQYSLLTRLAPAWTRAGSAIDPTRTRELVVALASDPAAERIFLEPHLRTRWRLDGVGAVAFHGCHAVRHDDHVHVQVR